MCVKNPLNTNYFNQKIILLQVSKNENEVGQSLRNNYFVEIM